MFRSVLVPSCRLSFAEILEAAERVNAGLSELAATHGARFVRLKPEWYGFDPIHIRPSLWGEAWREILGGHGPSDGSTFSRLEGLRLYFKPPERQWLFGVERHTPQAGAALPSGACVSLY